MKVIILMRKNTENDSRYLQKETHFHNQIIENAFSEKQPNEHENTCFTTKRIIFIQMKHKTS